MRVFEIKPARLERGPRKFESRQIGDRFTRIVIPGSVAVSLPARRGNPAVGRRAPGAKTAVFGEVRWRRERIHVFWAEERREVELPVSWRGCYLLRQGFRRY